MAAHEQHEHDPPCLTAALSYAARGWPVFPLMPLSKKPYKDSHGFKDATTDEAQIRKWWTDMPRSNVGIAMGAGLLVIDEDSYEGGDASGYLLPVTLTASTPSGGKHFYFSVPCPIPIDHKGTRLGTHIDIQGDGTYVVAPPSRVGNAIYEWLDESQRVAALPSKILAKLLPQEKPATEREEHNRREGKEAPRWRESSEEKWLAWALECGRSAGRTDDYGFQLAQQLLIAEANGEHIDTYGVLRQYASQATMDPSDPFTDADIARWLRRAEASDLVRAGEPARAQTNVTPFRREAAATDWATRAQTHTHTQGANALQGEGQPQAEAKPPRFQFISDEEVERMPPPRWLINGHLVASKVALIIGDYGSGKSFLGLDFALCLSTITTWHGCAVEGGLVAYIAGEGIGGMGKRITAWKRHHGVTGKTDLWVLGEAPQLLRTADLVALRDSLHALPKMPAAVFIDTVARSIVGAKENESETMGQVVAAADMLRNEFGCLVVGVHHTPKGATTSRGSSALPDGADTIILCTRDEKDHHRITVSCPKQKDFDEFAERAFELRVVPIDEAGIETSCILVPTATPVTPKVTPVRRALPRSAEYVLAILAECGPIGSTWTALLRLFKERSGMAEESFRFAVHLLEELGRVKNVDGHYLLTPVTPV